MDQPLDRLKRPRRFLPWRGYRKWISLGVGVFLVAGAGVFAARQVTWSVLLTSSPVDLGLLAAAVVGNLLVTGLLQWAVTLNFDTDPPVGPIRMMALVAVSGLVSYIPLPRAGLMGRIGYLKAHHNLPVVQSGLIVVVVLTLGVGVIAVVTASVLLGSHGWGWLLAVAMTALLSGITTPLARRMLRRAVAGGWLWAPMRAVDLLLAGARLWLALRIAGAPVGYEQAMLAAAGGLLVRLGGLTPNGLGLSEWVVGVLSGWLTPVSTATGAAAAVVDRAVEVVVVALAGGAGAWMLAREGRWNVSPSHADG